MRCTFPVSVRGTSLSVANAIKRGILKAAAFILQNNSNSFESNDFPGFMTTSAATAVIFATTISQRFCLAGLIR